MVVFEYRVVLPFTLEEFIRGFRYLCARQSQEVMASSANGEQVDRMEDGCFGAVPEIVQVHGRVPSRWDLCSQGSYVRNRLNLGTRLPYWVRRVVPEAALCIQEEYWMAYPYSFARYTSEMWPKRLEFTIESLCVANDVGETAGIFSDMTAKEQQECKTQFIDIAGEPVKSTPGVFQGDPTSYHSIRSGRGPLLGPFWWKRNLSPLNSESGTRPAESGTRPAVESQPPLMCIYKRAQCKVHLLPFASSIERITLDSTVRDMAILGFRNLFCWTDSWFHLSHSDLSRFEKQVGLPLRLE